MLTIWGRRNSTNVQKVAWAIGELQLEYQRRDVGGSFGGLDTAEFVALNPNSMIPVLQDGDVTVWESHAIVRYLAEKYGNGTLCPADVAARARSDMWMDWMHTTFSPSFFDVFLGLIRTPSSNVDHGKVRDAAMQLGDVWGVLDKQLRDSPYVAGDELTIGDIPLGVACYRYFNMAIERPPLANIEAWFKRLQSRTAYQQHVMIPFGGNFEEFIALEREPD